LQLGLGIAALSLGMIGLPVSVIPVIGLIVGLSLTGVGLVLGLVGLIVGLARNKQGLAFPIAGSCVSLLGVAVAILWWTVIAPPSSSGTGGPLTLVGGFASTNDTLTFTDPKDKMWNQPCKTYTLAMTAGKTYQIDMVRKDNGLDPFLRLEDSTGRQLAMDDDSGGNLNARIFFVCPRNDTYRIIATTLFGSGPYKLTVQER
jgi:hypothetical protein